MQPPTDTIPCPHEIVERLWRQLGLSVPTFEFVAPDKLPEAYRRLLVHESGMTATLERRWGEPMVIELLADDIVVDLGALFRFVVLRTRDTGLAVELATIRIPIEAFPGQLRRSFAEGLRPFGALLEEAGIKFRGQPIGYFQLAADALAAAKANVPTGVPLYGRINHLIGENGSLLCETAEILPRA